MVTEMIFNFSITSMLKFYRPIRRAKFNHSIPIEYRESNICTAVRLSSYFWYQRQWQKVNLQCRYSSHHALGRERMREVPGWNNQNLFSSLLQTRREKCSWRWWIWECWRNSYADVAWCDRTYYRIHTCRDWCTSQPHREGWSAGKAYNRETG